MYANQGLIDAVIEEMKVQISQHDWSVIEDLLSFLPEERLTGFLPDEGVNLMESRAAALRHWERMFRNLFVDDEHSEFIAGILAAAGKKPSMPDKSIQYLKAYLADLQHWSTGDDISSANFVTCGTPQMDSIEELKAYALELSLLIIKLQENS
jgi:hypothetical protein